MDVTDLKEELLLLRKENAELQRTDSAETEGQGEIMTEQRRITDELRTGGIYRFPSNRRVFTEEELTAIADRIDAAHDEAIKSVMNDALYHANDKDMADLGLVRLPKDANGEVIHLGDVVMLPDWPLNHHEVINLVYAHDGWAIISRHGSIEASEHTVHVKPKKPTVEDVLREMADRCYADEDEPRDRDAIIAEYAAKLRLAGDE